MEETKSVHFYRIFEGDEKVDYWISFDALFRKGNLVTVDLNDVEEVPAEERKKAQKQAKDYAEKAIESRNSKSKILLKPVKLLVGLLLVSLHFVGKNVSKLHSKL